MSGQAELVVDARCATGESPMWLVAQQALYWVDIPARVLHRWSAGGHVQWGADEMIGCIAPRAGAPGTWIAGMESGTTPTPAPLRIAACSST